MTETAVSLDAHGSGVGGDRESGSHEIGTESDEEDVRGATQTSRSKQLETARAEPALQKPRPEGRRTASRWSRLNPGILRIPRSLDWTAMGDHERTAQVGPRRAPWGEVETGHGSKTSDRCLVRTRTHESEITIRASSEESDTFDEKQESPREDRVFAHGNVIEDNGLHHGSTP